MKILLAGGGTLGSVTPLLALFDYLESRERGRPQFIFVGTPSGPERQAVETANIPFFVLRAAKLDRFFSWRLFLSPLIYFWSHLAAAAVIFRLKPDVLVSAGSYVAAPLARMARFARVPSVLLQMDLRRGLANRMMARTAAAIAVSLPEAGKGLVPKKIVVTGIPVRSAVIKVLERRAELTTAAMTRFKIDEKAPTVLIIGGGTGAAQINRLVSSSASELAAAANVIHITGAGKEAAETDNVRYKSYELLTAEELSEAYAVSDLIVSRAGMGAIAELAVVQTAFVLIPMPDSPQEENAAFFHARAGIPVLGKQTTAEQFCETILGYLRHPTSWPGSIEKMRVLLPANAAARFAAVVMQAAENRGA
ncbi:hypothetical protein EPN90_02290 [Patescibacteria group bacterium]|nr:MAG: hypothetical protein EPN90_02290 [Patescibacteria group bacterium]